MRFRATGSEPMLYTSSSTPASGPNLSIPLGSKPSPWIEHMFVSYLRLRTELHEARPIPLARMSLPRRYRLGD